MAVRFPVFKSSGVAPWCAFRKAVRACDSPGGNPRRQVSLQGRETEDHLHLWPSCGKLDSLQISWRRIGQRFHNNAWFAALTCSVSQVKPIHKTNEVISDI